MAQADFYQGTAAALIRMPSCPVCRWRERVLPHNQGRVLRLPTLITDTEDVVATLEKEPLRTRSDMHKRPPKLWIDILSTKKLWAPTTGLAPDGTRWYRFACRDMRPVSLLSSSHLPTDYYIEDFSHKAQRARGFGAREPRKLRKSC